ncbi:MAG: FeoA family protein [Saprospiraceae bacterium]
MKPTTEHSILELPEGLSYKLRRFSDQQIGAKLMTMGVLPGHEVMIVRRTAFSGAYYLQMEQTNIALRYSEAVCLIVES